MDVLEQRMNGYLEQLKQRRDNGRLKVVTGLNGTGKTRLLFRKYVTWLRLQGVEEEQILRFRLEQEESDLFQRAAALEQEICSSMRDPQVHFYILIDSINLIMNPRGPESEAEKMLLRLAQRNVDIYVICATGQILTRSSPEFQDRCEEIRMEPVSLTEFFAGWTGSAQDAVEEYARYGGLPAVLAHASPEKRMRCLQEAVLKPVCEELIRISRIFQDTGRIREILDALAALTGQQFAVASLTRQLNKDGRRMVPATVERYLRLLIQAGVLHKETMVEVPRRTPRKTPVKYYFADPGLLNLHLGFPEQMNAAMLENLVYLQMRNWGYRVRLGNVIYNCHDERRIKVRQRYEVDFAVEGESGLLCIQMAPDDPEELEMALTPLRRMRIQQVRCILLIRGEKDPEVDGDGIVHVGVVTFLLDRSLLDV